jgi:hypothetical protein
MPRWMTAGTILAISVVLTTPEPAMAAGGVQYGLFRTRAAYVPIEQRNCWIQGKISGETINGDLISDHPTERAADCALHREILAGRCVNQTPQDVVTACRAVHAHPGAE